MNSALKTMVKDVRSKHPNVYAFLLAIFSRILSVSTCRKLKGLGNVVVQSGAILKKCRIDVQGNNNRIEIAPECVLNRVRFFVRGDGHTIHIGPRCRIYRRALLWCEDSNCTLSIGDGSFFEEAHVAVTEPGSKVEIGSGCLFAYDIEVRSGDSHSIIDAVTAKRINPPANVTIGNRVWVGVGAKVLKGVEIGDDSIVATGAVVTKSIPQGTIVAGNPAKIIREGIRWKHERIQGAY